MGKIPKKEDEQNDLLRGRAEELNLALDRLSRHPFESGLYDLNKMPEGRRDS